MACTRRSLPFLAMMAWLAGSLFGSCMVAQQTAPRPGVKALAERPPAQPSDYRLAPNDLIQIKVYQEDDLLTTARVGSDGTIEFPLVGKIKVGGLAPADAARLIRDLLEKDYLVNPQVTATLLEFAQKRFTVLGQVQKPGTYDYPSEQTLDLLAAVGFAGGYTRIAEPSHITVKRKVQGKEVIFKLDAKKMAHESGATVFIVQPGDVISVGESIF